MRRVKITPLDKLFSECIRKLAIRNVGGCERCLHPKSDIQKDDGSTLPAWKQLQCAHFYSRSRKSTRYDLDNATGLCGACHRYFHGHPDEYTEFYKARLGDGYDLLQARQRILAKDVDESAITLFLKSKIEELDDEL